MGGTQNVPWSRGNWDNWSPCQRYWSLQQWLRAAKLHGMKGFLLDQPWLWEQERRPDKGQRCKILNLEKIRQKASGTFGFLSKETTSCLLLFLFILWSKETWLAILANKSDCTKALHDSISLSSQKKHDTEKPWIAAKHSSQRSMGFPATEFYGFFAAFREYLVWALLPEGPMWHITAPQST